RRRAGCRSTKRSATSQAQSEAVQGERRTFNKSRKRDTAARSRDTRCARGGKRDAEVPMIKDLCSRRLLARRLRIAIMAHHGGDERALAENRLAGGTSKNSMSVQTNARDSG